jgi:hypothetical protein
MDNKRGLKYSKTIIFIFFLFLYNKQLNIKMEYLRKTENLMVSSFSKPHLPVTLIVLSVLYSLVLVMHKPVRVIKTMNSLPARVLFVLLIALVGYYHPVTGFFLVLAFLVTLQTGSALQKQMASVNVPEATKTTTTTVSTTTTQVMTGAEETAAEGFVEKQIAGTVTPLMPDSVQGIPGCVTCQDLTFVPKQPQTNVVPNSNQLSCPQTFNNQYCVQGVEPSGVQGHNLDDQEFMPF